MSEEITSPELSIFAEKTSFDMPLEDGPILMEDDATYQEYLQRNKGGKRNRKRRLTRKKRTNRKIHYGKRRTHKKRR